MNERYEHKLAELRREIETRGARASVIDAAVIELLADRNACSAQDFLSLLSDSAEHDEGMFSLIHAAESFDDRTYVRAYLLMLPVLEKSAPRWASILLMRILNNDEAQSELVRKLHDSSMQVKGALREMCDRINTVSPKFLSKTIPVTLAVS